MHAVGYVGRWVWLGGVRPFWWRARARAQHVRGSSSQSVTPAPISDATIRRLASRYGCPIFTSEEPIPKEREREAATTTIEAPGPAEETLEPETHELELSPGAMPLLIREGIADYASDAEADNFGHSTEHDQTGCYLWAASLALASVVATDEIISERMIRGKVVVELGAGCGVPGLAAAVHAHARRVVLTDLNATTLNNLRGNASLNAAACEAWCSTIAVHHLDWADTDSWGAVESGGSVQTVIGSDLTYTIKHSKMLGAVLRQILPTGGSFIYCFAHGDRV